MDLTTILDKLLLPLALLAGQLWLNAKFKESEEKRDKARAETDAKRAAEAEWRDGIDKRLDAMDKRLDDVQGELDRSVSQQAVQIRSDIVHKCHRYLDDLGRASSEEKETLNDAYKQYCKFCADLEVENDFIDLLVQRVMELPEREV